MATRKEHVKFELTAQDKTAAALKQMRANLNEVAKATAMLGAAAAAAAYAIGRQVASGLKSADATAKTARALQMTSKELRAFELMADRTGVSSDQLTDAMGKMRNEVSRMAAGQGNDRVIKEIGLDVQELTKLRPAEQFEKITTQLANMGDRNRAASIAAELFKDRTGKLTNALIDQSGEIGKAIVDVDRYNLALSETDAQTLERVNDQFTLMGKIIQANRERLAVGMAPALETINELLIDFSTTLEGAGVSGALLGDIMITSAEVAYRAWQKLNMVILQGQKAIIAASDWMMGVFGAEETNKALANLERLRSERERVIKQFSTPTSDAGVGKLSEEGVAALSALERQVKITEDQLSGLYRSRALDDINKDIDALRKNMSDESPVIKWFDVVLDRMQNLKSGAADGGMLEPLAVEMSQMTIYAETFGMAISTGLENAARQGKLSMQDFTQYVLSQLAAIIIKLAVINPLLRGLGMGIGGDIGAGLIAAGGGAPGRSIGGPVQAGQTKLVGERGPEAVTFGSNAYIHTNKETMGGSSTVINIDARNADMGVVDRLRAMFIAMDSNFDVRAVSAVHGAMGRNPRIGRRA